MLCSGSGAGAGGAGAWWSWSRSWAIRAARYLPVFDDDGEPEGVVLPDEPAVPLPLVPVEAGLPDVPVSPVPEVAGELLELPAVPLAEPLALPLMPVVEPLVDGEVDDALLLPGEEVSVLLDVVDGGVLVVLDGVEELDVVLPVVLPECVLSQPAMATPARARAAAMGMSLFMTSPIGLWESRNRACARRLRATASRAL